MKFIYAYLKKHLKIKEGVKIACREESGSKILMKMKIFGELKL